MKTTRVKAKEPVKVLKPFKPRKRRVTVVWVPYKDKNGMKFRRPVRKAVRSPKDEVKKPRKPRKSHVRKPKRTKATALKRQNVMKFHFSEYNATRTVEDTRVIPPTFTLVRTVGYEDNLSGIVSGSGDHKRPVAQAFVHGRHAYVSGTIASYFPGGSSVITNGILGIVDNPVLTPSFTTTAYNTAVNRLYDSIRGSVDFSIDLAEAGKSASMLNKSLRAIATATATIVKMKRSNPRDWGNLWLEFTYGWKPLVNDIYEGYHKLYEPTKHFWIATGNATDREERNTDLGADTNGMRTYIAEVKTSRCRVSCAFSFAQSRLNTLAGFTSLNPVSIAWELLPYSFVADWFLNIGGYLRTFESATLYSSDFISGYKTETSRVVTTYSISGSRTRSDGTLDTYSGVGSRSQTSKRRTVLSSVPFPQLPVFKPQLGASRLISAASLLGQLISSWKH